MTSARSRGRGRDRPGRRPAWPAAAASKRSRAARPPLQARHLRARRAGLRRPGARRHAGRRHRRGQRRLRGGNASAPKLPPPADMKALIARYDAEWKARLAAIARDVTAARSAPPYVAKVGELRVHPPVRPSLILNAGGNYVEHTAGIAAQAAAGRRAAEAGVGAATGPGHLGAAQPATPATTRTSSRSRPRWSPGRSTRS